MVTINLSAELACKRHSALCGSWSEMSGMSGDVPDTHQKGSYLPSNFSNFSQRSPEEQEAKFVQCQ